MAAASPPPDNDDNSKGQFWSTDSDDIGDWVLPLKTNFDALDVYDSEVPNSTHAELCYYDDRRKCSVYVPREPNMDETGEERADRLYNMLLVSFASTPLLGYLPVEYKKSYGTIWENDSDDKGEQVFPLTSDVIPLANIMVSSSLAVEDDKSEGKILEMIHILEDCEKFANQKDKNQ